MIVNTKQRSKYIELISNPFPNHCLFLFHVSMCAVSTGTSSRDVYGGEGHLRVSTTRKLLRRSTSSTTDKLLIQSSGHDYPITRDLDVIMSATDLMIKHRPDFHRSYTDSIRRYGGLDCPDHNNDKVTNSQHVDSNKDQLQPQQMSSAEQVGSDAPATVPTTSTVVASPQMDLNREEARLVTFDNENWNVPFLNKSKLAQIGFYYIGPRDTVRCHFCRVEIGMWEPDDDCFTEHSRWSPSCPLLRRQQTDNVPIDAEDLNLILPPITYDTCGLNGGGIRPNAYAERAFTPTAENEQSTSESSPEDVGTVSPFHFPAQNAAPVQLASPPTAGLSAAVTQMYSGSSPNYFNPVTTPHLEIEANRLKTFKEWPINLKMKPVELCDAGFFYTGMGDRVQCFSCGGGLKNWEDNDVAWEQHALWYPNCEYMKLIKGQPYIDAVQTIHRQRQQVEAQREGEAVESSEEEESVGEMDPAAAESSSAGSSISEGQDEVPQRQRCLAGVHRRDPVPSTSQAGPSVARKIARRNCSMSHPEADLKSAEAIVAAKSVKQGEVPETKLCKICYESEFNTAFIPCGHVVACAKCASAVTTCPMCREPFDSVTRIYFS